MLKGEHDTIFGLSKPVVVGIVVFFFLVFGLAFFYAASDDSNAQTEKKSARVRILRILRVFRAVHPQNSPMITGHSNERMLENASARATRSP